MQKTELRKILRHVRKQISTIERLQFAKQIAHHFQSSAYFQSATHIAGYLAADGEVELSEIQKLIFNSQKKYYLPVLEPKGLSRLWFASYQDGATLIPNRYQILEPSLDASTLIEPSELDVVLVPLVGFDEAGNRLGMGKGFYDQTFSFLRAGHYVKPQLIGIAFEAQKVAHLVVNDWDIPLQGIITEKQFYACV